MSRNADLTQPVDPLKVREVAILLWKNYPVAIVPEISDVVGPRLTYAQIMRNEIPQLFERVGFGGVNFGLISGPESLVEMAKLVPLEEKHYFHIVPETVIAASAFRRSVARTVEQLNKNPHCPWLFIRCRRQILAVLEARPRGSLTADSWADPVLTHRLRNPS